jgi:hypothetical protein
VTSAPSPVVDWSDAPDDERMLHRTPSGYSLAFHEIGVVLEARQVRWEHGSLYAVVSVRARMSGIRTVAGDVVSESRVNISSDRSRRDVASACEQRAPGIDLDWRGLVEEFAIRVLAAEREGRPFENVGTLPPRVDPGYAIAPILPSGRVAFVYGPGGSTKGYLVTALCVSVETGAVVVPGLTPRRGHALYLDWESDRWDIDDRVKRIARGANLRGSVEIGYRECVGPLTDQVDDVEREVRKTGVTLLVIDSVGMALSTSREGGDANESTIRMFQALRRLPTTVVAVDHVVGSEIRQGAKSTRPYGSVYKVNLARNAYEVRSLDSPADDGTVRHVVIRHRKFNMSAQLPDVGLAVHFDNDQRAVRWEAEEVRAVPGEEDTTGAFPTSTRQLLRELLERGHLSEEELADETGRKLPTVGRVLRRYGSDAKKPEDRWFNRLPSGKWEALPPTLREVDDAG